MSDEALAWKIAFGALVLCFCGVAYVTREPARPVEHAKAAPATPAPVAPAALPAASGPMVLPDPAPPDIPDVQETPVGIHLPAFKEPARHRKSMRRVPAAKVHLVRHRWAASPYASGRKHYPFDPRERWHNRYS